MERESRRTRRPASAVHPRSGTILVAVLLSLGGCSRCERLKTGIGRPIVIAAGENLPRGIAVDSTAVYWVSGSRQGTRHSKLYLPRDREELVWSGGDRPRDGVVRRADLGGGSATTLVRGQWSPRGIAVDETSVYWTNGGTSGSDGSVVRVASTGGTPVTLASRQASPSGIALDATSVYWTNRGAGRSEGSVMRIEKGGGTPVVLVAGRTSPGAVATDETSVYWTEVEVGYEEDLTVRGRVMRVPKGGGRAVVVASGEGWPLGLAVDESGVYWTEEIGAHRHDEATDPEGAILRRPRSGGAPVVIASVRGRPTAIGVDEDRVYWVDENPGPCGAERSGAARGTLNEAPKEGGPRRVLASGLFRPNALAVSAAALLWTDMGLGPDPHSNTAAFDGTVSLIAKPRRAR